MRQTIVRIDRWVQRGARAAVILALVGITVLLTLGILVRTFPSLSLAGYDEIVELLVAWMTFLGAALIWREGSLYRVEVLADRLPRRLAWVVALFVRLLMLLFAVVLTFEGWRVAVLSAETTPFLRFPKSLSYASMPVAGLLMIAYAVSGIWQALTGPRPGGEGLSGRERG
ncbi:MAG: TRAP transporter small permease [Deltaproteobacteria bacterium]|nr:TRAP transporter small permease [Deltaproteobacteria bacterium]